MVDKKDKETKNQPKVFNKEDEVEEGYEVPN